ncbi:hypothetical protein [Arthrobacter sp. A2-55]|uniref:hypothetical protein n=1 Tax=Arthrobacter sp. A2-55 TaxID=2897337 RepID=UPI0021CD6B6C|nr:hypothetical protein [Arthrobacter sp. A2-55]
MFLGMGPKLLHRFLLLDRHLAVELHHPAPKQPKIRLLARHHPPAAALPRTGDPGFDGAATLLDRPTLDGAIEAFTGLGFEVTIRRA